MSKHAWASFVERAAKPGGAARAVAICAEMMQNDPNDLVDALWKSLVDDDSMGAVDWKAADEVQWTASKVAAAHQLPSDFAWDWETADPAATYSLVVQGLYAFDAWLQAQQYRLVAVDFGGDAHLFAVAKSEQADSLADAATSAGMNGFLLDGRNW